MIKQVSADLYERTRACAWVKEADHVTALALDPHRETGPVVLSGSGVDIWLALDKAKTIEALSVELSRKKDVSALSIVGQIEAFIFSLVSEGLIVKIPVG